MKRCKAYRYNGSSYEEEIRNKIKKVPDSTCKGCPQSWQGECRAFLLPHTDVEMAHRNQPPYTKC